MAELFGGLTRPRASVGSKRYTVTFSVIAHAALGVVLVTASVAASGVVPALNSVMVFSSPAPPKLPDLPAPSQPATAATPAAVAPAPTTEVVPMEAASTIAASAPPPAWVSATAGIPGTLGTPNGTGVDFGPPPELPKRVMEPIRPGGQIEPPVKLHDAAPVYPEIARKARVSGYVIVEAIIGTDGRVTSARVLRSSPLLDQAALAAVLQWAYRPTMLNGVPVSIIMTVTVTFTLK
jgi:protein TonB